MPASKGCLTVPCAGSARWEKKVRPTFFVSARLRHAYLGSFLLEPEDIKNLGLGATWNFSKVTGLPWFYMGHKRPVKSSPRCIGAVRPGTQMQINQSCLLQNSADTPKTFSEVSAWHPQYFHATTGILIKTSPPPLPSRSVFTALHSALCNVLLTALPHKPQQYNNFVQLSYITRCFLVPNSYRLRLNFEISYALVMFLLHQYTQFVDNSKVKARISNVDIT